VNDATLAPVSRRTDLLALALLFLIATISFADVLVGVNQLYMRDMTRYYYPAKQILREVVQHGEFPYWNRYFSAGQPIAANPEHEVFYPLTWLILLPSYDLGYRLHILIHLYIGLLGMYALLRSMELRPPAAWFGALSFGLGGLYLSYVNLLPILFCAAWLPLTCLFVRRFLLRKNIRDFAAAGLFLGLQFLVSEPTTVAQTGVLIGMYSLYRGWYSRPRVSKMITRVLWIAVISVTGFLLGAAQILPAIDHVRDSARSRPFEFDLVSAWSMPWAKFAELIYPNVLGHISIGNVMHYWGGGLYPGMGSPFLFSIYVGIAVTALAIGGAFARPRGGRFVLIIFLFSSLMAIGGHTPFLRWLYDAGIATSIRYPEKFILMGVFAMILFASQMLDRMLAGDEDVRSGALGFAAASMLVAAVLAIAGFTPLYPRLFNLLSKATDIASLRKAWTLTAGSVSTSAVELSRNDWIVAAVRGAILIALLITVRKRNKRVWLAVAAAFVTIDLVYVTCELNPREPRRFFDPPPVAKTFPANRQDFRIFHEADWYGTEKPAQQFFSTGPAVYWVVRDGLFPMTPAGSGLRTVLERDYDKTALLPTIDLTDSVWDVKRSGKGDWYKPFMAMSNAWYRAVYRDFETEKKRNHDHFMDSLPVAFEEGPHYPRYYFADQVLTIRDRADFVKQLTTSSFSSGVAFVQRPAFVPASGVVKRVVETANTAAIDVESFGQGFLVMSVTPHKYWTIRMDGRRVPAIVTNIAYQGIIVTPGKHHIEMDYRNELVRVGLLITLFTGAVLLGILIVYRPSLSVATPAYEEPVHVVADAAGTHLEAAVIETAEGNETPDRDEIPPA
jgi:TM2 domain-containing membrane protein YozV